MKEREKPIRTMPEGIWESSRPGQEGSQSAGAGVSGANGAWDGLGNRTVAGMQDITDTPADPSLTMDWQGNGYPGQPKSRTTSDNS